MTRVLLIILFLLIAAIVITKLTDKFQQSKAHKIVSQEKADQYRNNVAPPEPKRPLLVLLPLRIEQLEKYAAANYTASISSPEDVTEQLRSFKDFYEALDISDDSLSNRQIKNLHDKLQRKLTAWQSKRMPALRKQYAIFVDRKIWEVDLDCTVSGKANTVLNFTGYHFASNKNIQTTMESVKETVEKLRFKKVTFRWYEGADRFTYYNLDTPPDTERYYFFRNQ